MCVLKNNTLLSVGIRFVHFSHKIGSVGGVAAIDSNALSGA